MTENLSDLYGKLVRLAEAQVKALRGEMLENALDIAEKRREVVEQIEKFMDELSGKDGEFPARISADVEAAIERIRSVDRESRDIILLQLDSISRELSVLGKMRSFARNAAPHRRGDKLDINV